MVLLLEDYGVGAGSGHLLLYVLPAVTGQHIMNCFPDGWLRPDEKYADRYYTLHSFPY